MKEMGLSNQESKKIFIDRNPQTFTHIADIMRKSYLKKYDHSIEMRIKLPRALNHAAFMEDVKFYFKDDYDKVLEDFELYYLKSDGKLVPLNSSDELIIDIKIKKELTYEGLIPYKATKMSDIKRFESHKAFFVDHNSDIIFELKEKTPISSIEIKPFILDYDVWYPNEGAGAFVFVSVDGKTWEFVNAIPDDYGIEHTSSLIFFDEQIAKYIKIQTGDYSLSISYLKLG
jgi:hypothetical protein